MATKIDDGFDKTEVIMNDREMDGSTPEQFRVKMREMFDAIMEREPSAMIIMALDNKDTNRNEHAVGVGLAGSLHALAQTAAQGVGNLGGILENMRKIAKEQHDETCECMQEEKRSPIPDGLLDHITGHIRTPKDPHNIN